MRQKLPHFLGKTNTTTHKHSIWSACGVPKTQPHAKAAQMYSSTLKRWIISMHVPIVPTHRYNRGTKTLSNIHFIPIHSGNIYFTMLLNVGSLLVIENSRTFYCTLKRWTTSDMHILYLHIGTMGSQKLKILEHSIVPVVNFRHVPLYLYLYLYYTYT